MIYLWKFPNYLVCVLEDISLEISQLHCMCPWRYLSEYFPITLYVSLMIYLLKFPNYIVCVLEDISLEISQLHCMCPRRCTSEDFSITLYVSLKISQLHCMCCWRYHPEMSQLHWICLWCYLSEGFPIPLNLSLNIFSGRFLIVPEDFHIYIVCNPSWFPKWYWMCSWCSFYEDLKMHCSCMHPWRIQNYDYVIPVQN